jgi:hypothetical protein
MLTGYKIVHVAAHTVPAYSYRRKFTVKEKAPAKKPLSKNVTVRKKKAPKKNSYNFAVPSTGRKVTF